MGLQEAQRGEPSLIFRRIRLPGAPSCDRYKGNQNHLIPGTSMSNIRIRFRDGPEVTVALREDATPTLNALLAVLPFSSRTQPWGDEIYFETTFHPDIEHG